MSLLTYRPNEDSNEPANACSLISVFIVRIKKLCILGYPKCVQWRFWSDCANAQADLNLRWAHMSEAEGTYSDAASNQWYMMVRYYPVMYRPIFESIILISLHESFKRAFMSYRFHTNEVNKNNIKVIHNVHISYDMEKGTTCRVRNSEG